MVAVEPVDHSIQVDVFGEPLALQRNAEFKSERNRERETDSVSRGDVDAGEVHAAAVDGDRL
jgi:hypothetical protein